MQEEVNITYIAQRDSNEPHQHRLEHNQSSRRNGRIGHLHVYSNDVPWDIMELKRLKEIKTDLESRPDDIMNAIDKVTPLKNDTWQGNFNIIYEGKTVFEWSAGSQIS